MPANADFTVSQAQDLARHFLGPQWCAGIYTEVSSAADNRFFLASPESATSWAHGPTWRAAFRAAGVKLPYRPRYVSVGASIRLGDEQVAIGKSKNFALRIANALNAYEPDAKGQ